MSWQLLRRVRAQAPYLLVLALLVASLAYLLVQPDHWRRGTAALSAALFVAALLRLVLPGPHAGLLAARGRCRDAACYAVLGGLILLVVLRLH